MGVKRNWLAGALLAAALCLFAPAVGAEDNKTIGSLPDDGYTVTIPSTVSFAEGDTTQTLKISGTLGKYRTLDVTVASDNGYKLVYNDSNNANLQSFAYTLTGTGFSDNKIHYQTDENSESLKTELTATLKEDPASANLSGSYTDNLTFTFDCQKRTQECNITVKYESMDTTAEGEIKTRKRHSAWETETYTLTKTLNLGEEYTFGLEELFDKNSSVKYAVKSKDDTENKNAWETEMLDPDTHTYVARTYSITPMPDKTNYEIDVYRKLVWLDLNYYIYDAHYEANGHTTPFWKVDQGGKHDAGSATFKINGSNGELITDHWMMHPYGSTYEMSGIKNGGTAGTAYPDYEVYGYWIRKDSTDVENNFTKFDVDSTNKTIGSQTLNTTFKSGSTEYGGDYSEAVYVILRPYTVTIKYETMKSTKAVSSGSTHERHSDFPETGNEVIKGIAWDTNGTYTWINPKYTEESGYWKDEKYTVEKEDSKYDYEIGVLRKMYALDLNVALRTPNSSGGYTYKTFGSKNSGDGEVSDVTSWGQININVNDKRVATGAHDYFTGFPYGSTFCFSGLEVSSPYKIVGYTVNDKTDDPLEYNSEIIGILDFNTAQHNIQVNTDTEVTDQVIVWLIVEKETTSDEMIGDDEIILPAGDSTGDAADTTTTAPDDTLDDAPASDTDDTPTPSDDDDITPDDTDDTTDTPSDADDVDDDTDTGIDDTEPADDSTDDPDVDDGDVEDTDAAGDDALDDEPDNVDADVETALEPLDILA